MFPMKVVPVLDYYVLPHEEIFGSGYIDSNFLGLFGSNW
jgi:hypothetical protein